MGTGANSEAYLGKTIALLDANWGIIPPSTNFPLDVLFPNLPANINDILSQYSLEVIITTFVTNNLNIFFKQFVGEFELIRADVHQFFTTDINKIENVRKFRFIINDLKSLEMYYNIAPPPIVKASFTIVEKRAGNVVFPLDAFVKVALPNILGSAFYNDTSFQICSTLKKIISRMAVLNGDLRWEVQQGAAYDANGISLHDQNCFALGSPALVPFQTEFASPINFITRLTNLNPTNTGQVLISYLVSFE